MSNLRNAAQQALETLEDIFGANKVDVGAINALRAALTVPSDCPNSHQPVQEPAQEPVAWRWGYRSVTTGEMDWRGYATDPTLRSPAIMEPLYTAPPQRKPLSDEDAAALIARDHRILKEFGDAPSGAAMELIRAVERAHGIE